MIYDKCGSDKLVGGFFERSLIDLGQVNALVGGYLGIITQSVLFGGLKHYSTSTGVDCIVRCIFRAILSCVLAFPPIIVTYLVKKD